MKLLQALRQAAPPKPPLQRIPDAAPANDNHLLPEAAHRHFPVNLVFGGTVLLADAGMAALEFSTFGAACAASVLLAMALFPVGVLLQRYGSTRSSWPHAIGISAALCTLLAIPTSFGTMIPGAIAVVGHLVGSVRAIAGRTVDRD